MHASRLGLWSFVAVASVASFAACSATGSHQFTGVGGSTGSNVGVGGTTGAFTSGTLSSSATGLGSTTATGIGTSSSSTGGMQMSSAYAHTADTLYQLDPNHLNVPPVQIGYFDCIGNGNGQDTSMTDIAVDASGNLWGISSHFVYPLQISGSNVHCVNSYALNAPQGVVFYGLTFAPANVLGSGEVLVAANTAGELYSIVQNGNTVTLTPRGIFGTVPANDGRGHNMMYPNTNWELSGDIVFLANNGNHLGFATVRDCQSPPSTSNCNNTDTLIEIDVNALKTATATTVVTKSVRGQVVKSATCNDPANTSYGSMYGIAASGSNVLGFAHYTEAIVQIDNNDGSACLVQSTSGNKWDGAAITTVESVTPPTIM